jgi:hypothetical protein
MTKNKTHKNMFVGKKIQSYYFYYSMNEHPCIDIVAAMSVPDRRLYNVTSVHSGSTDYATLVRYFYLIYANYEIQRVC